MVLHLRACSIVYVAMSFLFFSWISTHGKDEKNETDTAPRIPFRMPPLTEQLPFAEDSGAAQASAERWTSVEGEFVLADATQVR